MVTKIGDMVPILLVKTCTFQMEQNRIFLGNFKYDYWIPHKKLVLDEIFNIFHKIAHISFNIGQKVLNVHILGHRFPSAGHKYEK